MTRTKRSGPVISAGIALVRPGPDGPELLLVHPGGPFWQNKDEHAWSIPKGLVEPGPDGTPADLDDRPRLEATARREFTEETGHPAPAGPLIALPPFSVGSGKTLAAFAARGDADADDITSNHFEMEWPPRSGRTRSFPEVDRAGWYDLETARTRLHKGQVLLIDRLLAVADELVR